MNSISKYQLISLLLITDMFSLFCLGGGISLLTAGGFIAACGLQLLLALPIVLKKGELPKWAKILYLIYAVFCGGTLFAALWRTSRVIYIPYESSGGLWGRLMTAGLIALVGLYSSSTGIRAIARAGVIAAAVGIFCLGIDLISALFNGDWSNISRAESSGGFWEQILRGFALSGGLGSFAVLMPFVRDRRVSTAVGYFAAKAAMSVVILLTAVLVSGGIMDITDFPVITAAQLSQPFSVQRIDSLFMVVFAIFAVFAVTLQLMTGALLLKELLPGFRRWRSSAVGAATIVAALLIAGRELALVRAVAAAAALAAAAAAATKPPAAGGSGR